MKEVKYIPGDLVEFCGKVQRIENIDKQTSYRVSIRLEHGWFVNKPEETLKFLKSIPLTFAILKANGWKRIEERDCSGYRCPDNWRLKIQNVDGRCFAYFCGELLCGVEYIHELQHLLFGLGLNSELKV